MCLRRRRAGLGRPLGGLGPAGAPFATLARVTRRNDAQTAAPARNFTITTAERVAAVVAGPPAWMRRLRRIEDLRHEIVSALKKHGGRSSPAAEKLFAQLCALVDAHNAYYPIEANLPIDPRTGRLMDRGQPWQRMPAPTMEALATLATDEA